MSISGQRLIYSCPDRPAVLPNYSLTQAVGFTEAPPKPLAKGQNHQLGTGRRNLVTVFFTSTRTSFLFLRTPNPSWPGHTANVDPVWDMR